MSAVKQCTIVLGLGLFLIPTIAHAAGATYTSSSHTIEVPDSFSITDLDVTLNLDADIRALEIGLTSPSGTRLGLYTRHQASGRKFRKVILDDEAATSLTGSKDSRTGPFRPDAPLSTFDGTTAQGIWTLDLKYTSDTPLDLTLHNWTLTFQGADPSTITGVKYHDQNGNSVRDNGEEGLSGWTLYLDTNNDAELDSSDGELSTTTDSEGSYQFTNLDIKDYVVREFFQPTWFQVAPRGNRLPVRTLSGQTAGGKDFGNIPESETIASSYPSTTDVPIQNDGEAVRARSTITVPDSLPVVDVNVTLDANAPLSDTRFSLIGPDGARAMLFQEGSTGIIGGNKFRSTTFDDQAPTTIGGSGDRPPFQNTYRPREFLTALNQKSAGNWTLEALDINPSNGTVGEILGWVLELRTPAQEEPEPVIIVPGMLVSVSPLTTFLDLPSNFWQFTIGARGIYTSLIRQFELSGHLEGRDVFVAHYDWRKPVASNVGSYLKPIIEKAKQETGSDKVDIVAHSMGGLLARSYIQGSSYENDVDQLITLGTPHQGAADAYVAWEGGDFPTTWSGSIKLYLRSIIRSLNIRKDINLEPPGAFRTFFPALKDLLPIAPFVTKNNAEVPNTSLTEQNGFLQDLQGQINELEALGVDVTAIVGTDVQTLASLTLGNNRSPEDIALDRWRDGHPVSEPIQPNSSAGDQRVLATSGKIGSDIIVLPNALHEKLPHIAREEILETLGIAPETFQYEPPDINNIFGITALSPIDPKITCGTKVLSKNTNTFPEAQYVADPSDPKSPKLLVIGNPPSGTCQVQLTGTASGEYHVVTCFADSDQDVCTNRQGTTAPNKTETYTVNLTATSFQPPAQDVVALLRQLKSALFDLLLDHHIKVAGTKLHGIATRLQSFGENYLKEAKKAGFNSSKAKSWYKKMQADFDWFESELEKQINAGNLDETALKETVSLRDQLRDAGL